MQNLGNVIKYNGLIIILKDHLTDPNKIVLEIHDHASKVSIVYKLPLSRRKAKELAEAIIKKVKS